MVEPGKYKNNVEKFERWLTIKDYYELYKTYKILPNDHMNEIPTPFKTLALMAHTLGIIISWINQHE